MKTKDGFDFLPFQNEAQYESPKEVTEAVKARGKAAIELFSMEAA